MAEGGTGENTFREDDCCRHFTRKDLAYTKRQERGERLWSPSGTEVATMMGQEVQMKLVPPVVSARGNCSNRRLCGERR
jgi:hypothetical protein